MNEPRKPHPENAVGPFYVVYGCCTACNVPMVEAPGLFEYDGEHHCYVKRQPLTPNEVTNVISAAWCAELECIRYRGSDREVLRRLAELDLRELCDVQPPLDFLPVIRNHVTFVSAPSTTFKKTSQLAQAFRDYLASMNPEVCEFKFRGIQESKDNTQFEFSWYEDNYHPVCFSALETKREWHIWCPIIDDRSVGNLLSSWLSKSNSIFDDVKWYSELDWNGSKNYQRTPY